MMRLLAEVYSKSQCWYIRTTGIILQTLAGEKVRGMVRHSPYPSSSLAE